MKDVLYKWDEPAGFRMATERKKPKYAVSLSICGGLMLVVGLIMALRGKPIEGNWPATIVLLAVMTVLLGWVVPFLISKIPRPVLISKKGIHRNELGAGEAEFSTWRWEGISRAEFADADVDGKSFEVFVIFDEAGGHEMFGISKKVDKSKVIQIVRQMLG